MIKFLILFLIILVLLIYFILDFGIIKIPFYDNVEKFGTNDCYVKNQGDMNVNMRQCKIYYADDRDTCDSYPELYKLTILQLDILLTLKGGDNYVQYNSKNYDTVLINKVKEDKIKNNIKDSCDFTPENLYEIDKSIGPNNTVNEFTYAGKRQFGCFLPLKSTDINTNGNIKDNIIAKYGNKNKTCIDDTNKTPVTNINCEGTNCPASNNFHVITNFDNIKNSYNILIPDGEIFLKIYDKSKVAFVKYNKSGNILETIQNNSIDVKNKFDSLYDIQYINPTPNTSKYPRYPITNNRTTYADGTIFNVMASSGENVYKIFDNDKSSIGWNTITTRTTNIEYVSGYPGEFLKFDMGESIVLKNFNLHPNTDNINKSPKNFRIYATNNDNSYNNLKKSGIIITDNGVINKDPKIITNSDYNYYDFINVGTNNTITFLQDTICDILIVGGGGAGTTGKGGGSSGGVLYYTNVNMTADTYTITVGSGGKSSGANGNPSKIVNSRSIKYGEAVGGNASITGSGASGSGNNTLLSNEIKANLVSNEIAKAGGDFVISNNYTPIRMYPPIPIINQGDGGSATNQNTISGQTYGNGRYTIYWSSDYGAWHSSHLFDGVNAYGAGGHNGHDKYNIDGYSISGTNLVAGYNGEWVRLKLPNAIYLSFVKIYMRNGFSSRAPYNYKIYGTNNSGSSWTEIISTTNASYSGFVHTSANVNHPNAFNEYGIVINKVGYNSPGRMFNFDELQFYGKELINNNINAIGASAIPVVGNNNYYYYAFTDIGVNNSITFLQNTVCDILVVGGGGGGGGSIGGGGGAGAVVYIQNTSLSAGTYNITVGDGGAGGNSTSGKGGNSTFGNVIAEGGGGVQGGHDKGYGLIGGSGGGATGPNPPYLNKGGAAGTSSSLGGFTGVIYGNRGGNIIVTRRGGPTCGTGGGGAGGAAEDIDTNIKGGNGGIGIQINITGVNNYYGGGGGGGAHINAAGTGGLGGGGNGVTGYSGNENGKPGIANTGGGGGAGAWHTGRGGKGGSGIVIIRVPATPSIISSGGGGGARGNGLVPTSTSRPDGGNGLQINIIGTNQIYAGGGGGFNNNPSLNGGISGNSTYGNGGNSLLDSYGNGNNGIVIIRWKKSVNNMTNWNKIYEHSPGSIAPSTFYNCTLTNTSSYRYYTIVVKDNWVYGGNSPGCSISQLELYGYEQTVGTTINIEPPAIYVIPTSTTKQSYLFIFDKNGKIKELDMNNVANFSLKDNFKIGSSHISDKLLNTSTDTPVYGKTCRLISQYINSKNNNNLTLNLTQIDEKIVEYNADTANIGANIPNPLSTHKNTIFNNINISGLTFQKYDEYSMLYNGKFYMSNDDNIYIKL
jgi:hypothetical protein